MKKLFICVNFRANPDQPSCAARGSKDLALCLEAEIAKHKLNIGIERSGCLGFCDVGPNLKLAPNGNFFHHFNKQAIPAFLKQLKNFASGEA